MENNDAWFDALPPEVRIRIRNIAIHRGESYREVLDNAISLATKSNQEEMLRKHQPKITPRLSIVR